MTSTTAPTAIIRSLLRAADTDIAAFFDYFTDDTIFQMGNNDVVHGRTAIEQWVGSYLRSVAAIEHSVIEEFTHDDDTAALRVDVTYTMQNGRHFTLPAITRTRIVDGSVAEYLIFMDPSPVAAATS